MQAQEAIVLEGQILNDTIEKASLSVVNVSMRKASITTENGAFTILAREKDTINISAVQYESRQFVVNHTIYNRKKISLYLLPKVTELDEVNISNIELTGDIKSDVNSSSLQKQLFPKDLGIAENTAPSRTREERKLYTASTGTGEIDIHFVSILQIPLNGLINNITGKTKKLKKHVEVSNMDTRIKEFRWQFSDDLFIQDLDVKENQITDFLEFVLSVDTLQIEKENKLEQIVLLQQYARKYVALKEKEQIYKQEKKYE